MSKSLVIGIARRHGIGKNSQKPYDFTQLIISTAAEERDGVEAAGHQVIEYDAIDGLVAIGKKIKLPCVCEVETDSVIKYGKPAVIATGINPVDQANWVK